MIRSTACLDWRERKNGMSIELTKNERTQIGTILLRRANEIASFKDELRNTKDLASVDYALELEISRLRQLAYKIMPPDEVCA